MNSFRQRTFGQHSLAQIGIAVLLAAGVVVAIAISTDGVVSRTVNGIAGLLWIGAALVLLAELRDDPRFWPRLGQVALMCLILVIFIRPSDMAMALAGFSAAGAIIGNTIHQRSVLWAAMLAALWLPIHLGTAVVKAVYRSVMDEPASLRSDPPPTAAVVPLVMIASVLLAAWLVQYIRTERRR